MKELELKIEIDAATAERLGGSAAVLRFSAGEPVSRALRTIYLDSPDLALAKAGIALRLRHDGTAWTQTLKEREALAAGLSEARECEAPVAGPAPELDAIADATARARLHTCLAGAPLAPVFETDIARTTRRLDLPHLGTVELALDTGEITAGGRRAPVREAEIELVSGSPRAVFEAARQLFPDGGVRLSRETKADRGARLAQPEAEEPAARLARDVDLSAAVTTEQGARAVFAECLDQVSANIAVVLASEDPEGPHQLRVGLRRLRSAIQIFAPALGAPGLKRLDGEARWLSHEAGRVRDLDVAAADILRPLADAMPEEPGFEPLLAALAERRAQAMADLRTALLGKRAWAFLLDTGEYIAARGWLDPGDWEQTARLARPLPAHAAEALDQRLSKVLRRGADIEDLEIEARHELRKELKKLRYTVEFVRSLFPEKAVRSYGKRLREMQALFGDLQDVAMAELLFRAPDAPLGPGLASARAAGLAIGVYAERARRGWEEAKGLWKSFKAADPFWR